MAYPPFDKTTGSGKTSDEVNPAARYAGEAQACLNAGQQLAEARLRLEPVTIGGIQAVLLPVSANICSLEKWMERPARKRGVAKLLSVDSFIAFFNEHKLANSRIFTKQGNFVAVLDYHGTDPVAGARWCEFRATFGAVVSEGWRTWNEQDGKWFHQKGFAEFMEDNAVDVIDPTPAEMMEISRTLEARKDVMFRQAIRLENGDTALRYEEVTTAKSGLAGELEIPKQFTVSVPIYGLTMEAHMRLKFKIEEGRLALKFEIIRKAELLEMAARGLIDDVNDRCTTQCYEAEEPAQVERL